MTLWLTLAILAQCIIALAVLVDKYILLGTGHIGKPTVYAFYVSILSGFVVVLVPFGYISWPSLYTLELSGAVAVTYILALVLLYKALKVGVPSDVMPVVGSFTAIFTYILSFLFLNQDVPASFTLAFVLLIAGSLLISHFRFSFKEFLIILYAGAFFGASSILVKILFTHTSFIDGFFWSRMANVVGALLLLCIPGTLRALRAKGARTKQSMRWLVVGNKGLNGFAFVMTLYAIHLGSASIINALAGLQFVFLFLFAYLFGSLSPRLFHGETRPHDFPHKLFGTLFIVAGLSALFAPELLNHL